MKFKDRLVQLRKEFNLTQTEFAEKIGFSRTAISAWEIGRNEPSNEDTIKIADFFGVSVDYIIGNSDSRKNYVTADEWNNTDEFGNPITRIHILGVVKAGYNYLAEENWIGTVDVEKSLVGNGEDFFALKIHGDSMSPFLIENDIVVIKKQDDFENGDIVVAIINGDEATIKKGKKSENSILLQPLNNNYEPLIFTYDEMKSIPVTIVGVVKQLKREI